MAAVDHPPVTVRTRRLLALLLVPLLVVTAIGAVLLWPTGEATTSFSLRGTQVDATISALRRVPCTDTAPEAGVRCTRPVARVAGGGTVAVGEVPLATDLDVGDQVVLSRTVGSDGTPAYELDGYRRGRPVAVLACLALVLLLLVARRRGLQLLVALALSGVVLAAFTVPAAQRDGAALGIAVVSAALVATSMLVVGRGTNARTATALVGALVGLGAAGLAGLVAVTSGHLGGIDADPASAVPTLERLVLAGMVVAAVGVVVQVAVDLVDATWDLRDTGTGWRAVGAAGLRRGRERVAGSVGTLALAYAGIGLGALALFTVDGASVGDVLAGEPVATVVLGALVGVLAVVVTAPVTAALAATIVVREAGGRGPDDPRRFRSRRERDIWESET